MGTITAYFAQKRGRDLFSWFIIGMLLGILGLIILFLIADRSKVEPEKDVPEPILPHVVSKDWFYLDDNRQQHDPVSTEELKSLRERGEISSDTYVWSEGMEDWKKLQEIPEFE